MLKLAIIYFVLAGVPAEPQHQSDRLFDFIGVAMIGTAAGDYASTKWALGQNPMLREGNPLTQTTAGLVTFRLAVPTFAWWATERLYERRPKLALWLRVMAMGASSYAMVHNMRHGRR